MINIIAEIGVNHNGDIGLAKEMIASAAECGANYAKFQSWTEQKLRKGAWDEDPEPFFNFKNKRDFFKKVQITDKDHRELISECDRHGINFLTTCFDRSRVEFLSGFGLDSIKVASSDAASLGLIKDLSKNFGRIIASTGMASNKEITSLGEELHMADIDFVLMYCVSMYPTPIDRVSLSRMEFIKKLTKQRIDQDTMQPVPAHRGEFGISDHSLGLSVPITAIAKGATWVEKHFTIDKNLPGPDNQMSSTPSDFKAIRSFADDFIIMQNNKNESVQPEEIELKELIKDRFGDNK
jgi:N,N'-diacetyllegionaminate synthase